MVSRKGAQYTLTVLELCIYKFRAVSMITSQISPVSLMEGQFDWCCFDYFVTAARNSLVALLELSSMCSNCNEIAAKQWRWETGHHPARKVIHAWQTNWSKTGHLLWNSSLLHSTETRTVFPTIWVYTSLVTSHNSYSPGVPWHESFL